MVAFHITAAKNGEKNKNRANKIKDMLILGKPLNPFIAVGASPSCVTFFDRVNVLAHRRGGGVLVVV